MPRSSFLAFLASLPLFFRGRQIDPFTHLIQGNDDTPVRVGPGFEWCKSEWGSRPAIRGKLPPFFPVHEETPVIWAPAA